MNSRDFCYWLQGYFEIRAANMQSEDSITPVQIEVITRHLNMVFKHEIDPSAGPPAHQAELDAIHNPPYQGGGIVIDEAELRRVMEAASQELKAELEKMLKEHAKTPHYMRPGSDPMIRC